MERWLMFSNFLKSLSILKKFLFINLVIFLIIGFLAALYISNAKPNLIKNKTSKHIQIINNTIEHILRLNIKFEEEDIRRFLFSTRFLFQNLDRVILFNSQLDLVGDTDTLDLDPRSFSNRLNIVQLEILNQKKYLRDFSKGNQKKVGLIATFIGDPKVVILDEPFANLDPTTQIRLKQLIKSEIGKRELTLLISSHDLNHVTEVCSRIVLLEKGKVIMDKQTTTKTLQELEDYFSA